MSLLDYKITDQSVQGVYVQSQPDRLTGTPQQNKAAFDAYPALIRKQFNLLVDALGAKTAAGEIPIQSINGVQAQNVQQALAAIQQNLTAYINKLKATTGAAEVGVSTISGISAGNVQKALEGLRTIQITLNSNIQKLMSVNGAASVGVRTISGMQAQNVQKALEELRKAIEDSVSGIIPGGSITVDMLDDNIKAVLNGKAESTLGQVTGSNLLTWASEQTASGAFGVNPSITTAGVPIVGWYHGALEVKESGLRICITESTGSNRTWINCTSEGKWIGWVNLVNATPPKVRNLTLQSGFTPYNSCTFFKIQENVTFLVGGITGTMPENQDTQIGTLPADIRPSGLCRRAATTDVGMAYIEIHTDGTVWAHPFAAASQCWFDTAFVAVGGT